MDFCPCVTFLQTPWQTYWPFQSQGQPHTKHWICCICPVCNPVEVGLLADWQGWWEPQRRRWISLFQFFVVRGGVDKNVVNNFADISKMIFNRWNGKYP